MPKLMTKKIKEMECPLFVARTDPSYIGTLPTACNVHTILETDRAINAFNKMVNENVSGVAIVNDEVLANGFCVGVGL